MDVEALYDEFGNYIGPGRSESLSSSASESLELPGERNEITVNEQNYTAFQTSTAGEHDGSALAETQTLNTEAARSSAIILPEDKQYYPSAEDVFGPDTEVLVEEEDAQPISEPIIPSLSIPSSGLHESSESVPASKYSRNFLTTAVLPNPELVRNVALVGHLHHGKTSFVDMLFDVTHSMPWANLDDRDIPVRYMDTRRDEQDLHISIKTTASTFLLQTLKEKSFGVTVLDTPGHLNFLDEAIAAMTLADGAVLFVDAAEGVMMGTEVLLRHAASLGLDIVLVISKLDRLCLELRLPPRHAYHKIRHIIDYVNEVIAPYGKKKLDPRRGNVAFAASSENVCFTLKQFAQTYIEANGGISRFPLSADELALRFWGDVYFDRESRKFTKESMHGTETRTFVSFILEPFYKLHTAVLSEDVEGLTDFLDRNLLFDRSKGKQMHRKPGSISKPALDANLKAMLKEVGSNSFGMGSLTGFTEMIVTHVKSPVKNARSKLDSFEAHRANTRNPEDEAEKSWVSSLCECDASEHAPLAAYVGKLIPDERGENFDCLVRVLNGVLRKSDIVHVLGNAYHATSNKEDQAVAELTGIYLPGGRFKIELEFASAGQVVLIKGIDNTVFKSATIVSRDEGNSRGAFPLRPLHTILPAGVVKIAVEPIKPSELPKMVSSLRKCVNSFPGMTTKVEETGEHTLLGSGELYMDCILRDLRESHGAIEVKVSDPVVPFAETVSETSALQCYADTPNGKNKFVMIAEPLEPSIMTSLEEGVFERVGNSVSNVLRKNGWDALAAKSLWTFGPDMHRGPNALLNDVLIQDTRKRVEDVRESVVQGFSWAMREGPLADEPVRGVKLRLLDSSVAEDRLDRSPAQIIPTCRRVAYSSILTATPRLMEPVNATEIVCPPESLNVAYMLVNRRRGNVLSESEVAGTPLKRAVVHMPVLDSFGFEPDLRHLTHGTAFCMQLFDHWGIVPGDPLDKSIELRPLEPAGRRDLARECMVKTRRRKGMPDEVSITKYFDDPLLVELAQDNEELRHLI